MTFKGGNTKNKCVNVGNINIEMQKKSSLKPVVLRGGVLAFSVGRDGGCTLERVVGMEMGGATGGASKARMPEMNAQRLCRTQSQQSVHKEARVMVQGKGWMFFQMVVRMGRVDATGGASPLPYEKWVG